MDFVVIAFGVGVGVAVAAPIGPVNLICAQRTLRDGWLRGFLSGLGAAVGDGCFALAAALGVGALSRSLSEVNGEWSWVRVAGGAILLVMAAVTWRQAPRHSAREENGAAGAAMTFVATFALTITNPATLFGFGALFASFSASRPMSGAAAETAQLVASVFAGSLLWWAAITAIVHHVRHLLDDSTIVKINHACAIALAGFGLWVLWGAAV